MKCKGVNLLLTRRPLVDGHSDALDSGLCMDYFHHELLYALKGIVIDEEIEIEDDDLSDGDTDENEYTTEFYLDQIIYQYLTNQPLDIDKSKLIPYMLRVDGYTYMTLPLVIYIIKKYYDSYFTKTEL